MRKDGVKLTHAVQMGGIMYVSMSMASVTSSYAFLSALDHGRPIVPNSKDFLGQCSNIQGLLGYSFVHLGEIICDYLFF